MGLKNWVLSSKHMYNNNHIEITLTSACNVMCSYCPQTNYIKAFKALNPDVNFTKENRNMTFENFKKIVKNINHHVKKIYFTGFTEPMQNPFWYDCVNYSLNLGYEVFFNTTLIGARRDDIDKLLTLQIPVRVHLTDSRKKINPVYYELLDKNYKGSIHFDYFTQEGAMLYSGASKTQGDINSRSDNIENIKTATHTGKVYCNEFRQFSNVVLPDGNVAVCCSDFSLKHIFGNLLQQKLSEIHNSEKTQNFIYQMLSSHHSFCNNCEYAVAIENPKSQIYNMLKVIYRRLRF